ncbi:MAG: radical SAM protein [Deltaproteobacteria bacterium]|nr:radical SAM protein [Deltaproteobacteria bacterium]
MAEAFTRRLPMHEERRADGSLVCRPRYAVWEITLRCDQACRFCGTRAGRPREDELSTAEAVDVVRQLADMGCMEVALHGGETYLRDDWLDIVRAIRDHGMDCTMVTGGRGMTQERARAAKEAGIHAVSVSIDGLDETHDALRGLRGSRAAALRALHALKDVGVRVGCNTQLNQRNYRELLPLADELATLGLYGWQVQLMVPMGRAADASELWLQPYDLLSVIPEVAAARERCDAVGLRLWPGDNIGYFGPYEHVLRKARTRGAHSGGCGGGIITLGIEANGDVKGCSAMATEGFVAGNVRDEPLAALWEHAPELRFTRDFVLDDLWGACATCYYADVCKGGCVWTASALLGRRGNNPYCHHRALELLAAGKRERLELVHAAAGLIRDRARFELHVEDAPPEWIASLTVPRQLAPVSGGGP